MDSDDRQSKIDALKDDLAHYDPVDDAERFDEVVEKIRELTRKGNAPFHGERRRSEKDHK